ncbi:Rv3235 family protein [Micromonospora chalcea]|uniref:Rv3235 family protein n=1 Tax=Micromonospora chalcea TaxID=1874 RepID=UPI002378D76E|nr:Rv3235 family protein [Micromonospora chalcea]WDP99337.1 Rv3235 family protein [Micromonospora chalcea]
MVDTRRPRAPRPPVRLRPAPPLDPPCVDEEPLWSPVGQLTLDLSDPRRDAAARPAGRAPDPAPAWPRWTGTPASALASAAPEGTRAAHRFVRTFLEIVNGFRPPGQLRPLCVPESAGPVAAELTRAARRVTPVRRRTARPTLLLRRLRVCEPRAGAVEATAVFAGVGGTSWAVAIRLERRRGTWLCLVLDVL